MAYSLRTYELCDEFFNFGLIEQFQIPGAIRQLNMHIIQQMNVWYPRNPNSLSWQLVKCQLEICSLHIN